MLDSYLNSDTFSSIDIAAPLNRQHPLNYGRIAWWLTIPELAGGKFFYDLLEKMPATLTPQTGVLGWKAATRPGGFGQVSNNGLATVTVGTADLVNGLAQVSIGAWVYLTSFANTPGILGVYPGIPFIYRINTDGTPQFYIHKTTYTSITGAALSTGTWYRMLATYDGVTMRQYVNGIQDATTASLSGSLESTGTTMYFGSDYDGTDGITGAFDDMTIWNRSLSAREAMEDYNLSRIGYPGVLNRPSIGAFFGTSAAPPATVLPYRSLLGVGI